ncbi:hypothetical protein BO86DRAFT_43906 [Aspergillus japonicus CBS 114.51]|uniref:Uncharacterized protein n=1 Tax=Aspergillus japonicus CBS 114.51 TaxID=1448312 RepID=A0A8T8X6W4_ASPJA|nr:hypothetical protein BO86DRAFT_43906 [Aspergillus japonicus CBS 114.51]RAH83624.1 hypothetical protein BO86DRAFT_43906 [Aspergillus japonicus CBS 114.51]
MHRFGGFLASTSNATNSTLLCSVPALCFFWQVKLTVRQGTHTHTTVATVTQVPDQDPLSPSSTDPFPPLKSIQYWLVSRPQFWPFTWTGFSPSDRHQNAIPSTHRLLVLAAFRMGHWLSTLTRGRVLTSDHA